MVYLLAPKCVYKILQRVAVTPGDPQPGWDSERIGELSLESRGQGGDVHTAAVLFICASICLSAHSLVYLCCGVVWSPHVKNSCKKRPHEMCPFTENGEFPLWGLWEKWCTCVPSTSCVVNELLHSLDVNIYPCLLL